MGSAARGFLGDTLPAAAPRGIAHGPRRDSTPADQLDPDQVERRRLLALERVEAEKLATRGDGPATPPVSGDETTGPPQPRVDYFQENIPAWTDRCVHERSVDACRLLETAYLHLRQLDKLLDAATNACLLGSAGSCTTVGVILLDEPHLTAGRQPRDYFQRACDGGDASGCAFLAASYPNDAPEARAARRRACGLGARKYCR